MKNQEALTYVEMLERLVIGLAKRVKEAEAAGYADIGKECFTQSIGPYKFFGLPDPVKAKWAIKKTVGTYCMKQGERLVEKSDPVAMLTRGWIAPEKQAAEIQRMIVRDCAEAVAGLSAGCVSAAGENVRSAVDIVDSWIENCNVLPRMFGAMKVQTFNDYPNDFVEMDERGDIDGMLGTYAKHSTSIDPEQPAAGRVVRLLGAIKQ